MKNLAIVTATFLILGVLGFALYAQKGPSSAVSTTRSVASGMPMGTGMMSHNMMGNMGNGNMMAHYWGRMRSFPGQESPASILAFQNQLKLSDHQVTELRHIERQAKVTARNVLTRKQLDKYDSYMHSPEMNTMMKRQGLMMAGTPRR